MKKFVVILLASMLVLSVKAEGQFVGSINSDVYHYPSCAHAKNINEENQIWFVDAQDAVNHGYRPCSVCNPPLPVSTSPTPTPTATSTPTPSPTATPSPTPSPTEFPTLALVGVAGVVGVSAVSGAVFFLKRKRLSAPKKA